MKRDSMSKLSASFFVLVMALSALAFLPATNVGQGATGKNIFVPVISGGVPVSNAVVNLTDVHTGQVTTATFSSSASSYVVSSAAPAYYRVDIVAPNNFGAPDATEFVFKGFQNFTANPITLTPFPSKTVSWNVTVRAEATGSIVSGAVVGFYSNAAKQFVATGTTNALGFTVIPMFTTASAADYALAGIKSGFETNASNVLVSGTQSVTMLLNASMPVSVYAKNGISDTPALNVVSYLVNTNPNVVWVKRVLKTTGALSTFDAYPGTYTLVIDAPGLAADVESVTVAGSPVSLTRVLTAQTQRVERVNMTFGADYGSFGLNVRTTWPYDDPYPGLMFNDMGSLRVQVDLVLGNGNGVLEAPEVSAFLTQVSKFGTQYVTSAGLLLVNNTVYDNASQTNLVEDLAASSVVSTLGVNYSYDCAYTEHVAIPVGVALYVANVTARFDSPAVDFKYRVGLVTDYELVANQTQVGSLTRVSGYSSVLIDTQQTGSGTQLVQLTVQVTLPPVAGAGIDVSAGVSSPVTNKTGVVLRYVVKVGANISFSANTSVDPNHNPLVYFWDFDDGSSLATVNKTVKHLFTTPSAHRDVNLTVTDVAGLTSNKTINVTCDDLKPTPVISSKGWTIVGGAVSINQRETVILNATSSYDDAAAAGDKQGVISTVMFDWGDGNKTGRIAWTNPNQNVSNTYQNSGTFNVTLNVTDVTGHYNTTLIVVHVNDTTKPTVSYTVRNDSYGANLIENDTLHFDASATRDNANNYTLMHYSWNFGDGVWDNVTGFNVTHKYTRIGSVQVVLNVTDLSGNYAPTSKIINIQSGARPNLIITRVYYSPGNFTEGSSGTILVNVTNTGSATATNIVVQFYIVPENGGPLKLIGTSSQLFNATSGSSTTELLVGGKGQIKFSYTAPSHGTFTIKVNVTSTDQLTTFSRNADSPLHVKSAPWKTYALWGGVAAVIIVVPTLLFLSRRWAKREKKGPRRERKSGGSGEKPGSSEDK